MANRPSRADRRARRQSQLQASGAAAAAPPVVPPSPGSAAGGDGGPRGPLGGGARRFVSESWGELKKVEWPTQNQVIQGVAVVLIACLIVGIFLYGADRLFEPLV